MPAGVASVAVRRWLALCMAALLAASAFLYAEGHAQAFPSGQTHHVVRHAMDHTKLGACTGHGCDHQGSGNAGRCVSGLGCAFCAPLSSNGFVAAPQGRAFGMTSLPVSAPGEIQLQLRPPKLFVTA